MVWNIENKNIVDFLKKNVELKTPFVVVDLNVVKEKYMEFRKSFDYSKVFYAVKANPAKEIILLLNDVGANFDVASIEEVNLCLELGVSPEKISFGTTIKKSYLIKEAFEKKINIFAFDSEEELKKLAINAPGANVYCRLLLDSSENADWPLSRKFGCDVDMAVDLLSKASEMGLNAYGVSFHTGSQQFYLPAWEEGISKSKYVFSELKKQNINLKMINMGGGFPAYGYIKNPPEISQYKQTIEESLEKHFGNEKLDIFFEPGRFIVGDAGVIKSEVVLVSKKNVNDDKKWLYIDIGAFGGLAETIGESIKYNIVTNFETNEKTEKFAIAGPTCDGADILYEKNLYSFPSKIASGDFVYLISTGAYTTSYSAVCFNGFLPLKDYFIPLK
jgi:ornithine decarboxylase